MVPVKDTKKLRKVLPISLLDKDREGQNLLDRELSRAKRLPLNEKIIDDTWSRLLGEPKEPSRLFYEKGAWNLSEDKSGARDTREGIIWDNIPKPRLRVVPEEGFLKETRKPNRATGKD